MVDNVAITAGTGTTIATDDIAGVHYQRVKPTLGADGTAVDVSAGAGAVGTGVQRVTLASDDPAVAALQILDNAISGSEMQVDVVAALPAGSNLIGSVDLGATDNAVLDAMAASLVTIDGRVDGLETLITSTNAKLDTMTTALQIIDNFVGTSVGANNTDANTQRVTLASNDVVGAAIVDAIETAASPVVNLTPATSGGLSIFRSIDLDESEEEVKATAGQVYSMWVTNLATSTRFIKFYNETAANVTVGVTAPVLTIPVPGNSSDDIAGVFNAGSHGVAFSAAICVAATTGLADNDTGAPSAGDVVVNIFYK
jgi:hypothetical protein